MTVHIEERTPLAAQANLDPLARILNYKSPEYSIAAGHSPNSSTRPPKLFDMHLHKDLRLKKIEILNDLPRIISEVCNDYIKPNSGIPLYAVNHYSRSWADSKKAKISNEEDLVNAYSNLVPTFQRAASFLRFRTPWRNPALLWSATPSVFYPGRKEAVADGFLSTPASFDGLPAALREEMELLDKYCLNHFGVWEFKSLVCGPKIMSAIPKLEGDFLWTTCQERIDSNHRSHSCTSAVTSHRVDGRPIVSGRRAGPDADGDTVLKKASNCTQALHSKRKIGESDDEQVALDDKRKRTQERDLTAEKCARLMQENAVIVSDFKKLTEDERYRVCGHDIAQQVCLLSNNPSVVPSTYAQSLLNRLGPRLLSTTQPSSSSALGTFKSSAFEIDNRKRSSFPLPSTSAPPITLPLQNFKSVCLLQLTMTRSIVRYNYGRWKLQGGY